MDKTTGFALLGFLGIVLASGFGAGMAGGGGGGGGMMALGGGGGGGGGGDVCSQAIARMRTCQGALMADVPAEYRDRVAEKFEEEMVDAYGDCSRAVERKPEEAAEVRACLSLTDCEAFVKCL